MSPHIHTNLVSAAICLLVGLHHLWAGLALCALGLLINLILILRSKP